MILDTKAMMRVLKKRPGTNYTLMECEFVGYKMDYETYRFRSLENDVILNDVVEGEKVIAHRGNSWWWVDTEKVTSRIDSVAVQLANIRKQAQEDNVQYDDSFDPMWQEKHH